MAERLMHISCVVRDTVVWDILRGLEQFRAGNVEVRHVEPRVSESAIANGTPLPALPAPATGGHKQIVRAAMVLGEVYRATVLATQLGLSRAQVAQALRVMEIQKVVKRTGVGRYMLTAKGAAKEATIESTDSPEAVAKGAGKIVADVLRANNGQADIEAIHSAFKTARKSKYMISYVLAHLIERQYIERVSRGIYRLVGDARS